MYRRCYLEMGGGAITVGLCASQNIGMTSMSSSEPGWMKSMGVMKNLRMFGWKITIVYWFCLERHDRDSAGGTADYGASI